MEVIELGRYGDQLIAEFGGEKDQAAEKWPLYGRGLSLFFERPYISTVMGVPGVTFKEGMAMGVEAFLTRSGVGSAGFEQNIIVGKNGSELVTTSKSVWW